ncbi:MAG: cation transporter, partial [Theionarchaea archaeon]|nr:cation transporter [Theionarchaea archaeon]
MEKIVVPIEGMHCAACAQAIENALNKKAHVKAVVNFAGEEAVIEYDPQMITVKELVKTIQDTGYDVKKIVSEASIT